MRFLTAAPLLALAACNLANPDPGGTEDEAETEASAAPSTPSDCQRETFEGSVLTRCVADPEMHRIVLALKDNDGRVFRTMPDYAARRPADAAPVAFAMNAGMYDEVGEPIGYYVENGERIHELNRNEGPGNFHLKPNGVFYVAAPGEWRIRTTSEFYEKVMDRPLFGTQSGPMLVIDGAIHPEFSEDGDSRKTRNGVGIDASGRAHFVISEGPISFGKFARYYRDEVQAEDALFLDGSVSSLWDPANDRLDIGPELGPLVVVERKAG
ncbi:phosphodiester glycosidase family protein [Altererythrobacter sp. CAU 1778]